MQEWFEAIAGPNYASALMWTFLALLGLFVILLIVRMIRRMRTGTYVEGGRNRRARLAILDATAVDDIRRLVLIRRDDVEHLILIGGPSDVVVEQNIRQHGPAEPRIEPDHASPKTTEPAYRTVRDEPVADRRPSGPVAAPVEPAAVRTEPMAPPPPAPEPEAVRQVEQPRPPRPAVAPQPARAPAVHSTDRKEPVMTPQAQNVGAQPAAPVAVAATAGTVTQAQAAPSHQPVDPAPSLEPPASAPAYQSIELDDALLNELEASLEPQEVQMDYDQTHDIDDGSLDEEMARLLGDLSEDGRR